MLYPESHYAELLKDEPWALVVGEFGGAIFYNDLDNFKELIEQHRSHLAEIKYGGKNLLLDAVARDRVEMARILIAEGLPVDPMSTKGNLIYSPVLVAVRFDALNCARLLLEHGADPNQDWLLISAVDSNKHALELTQLVVQFGADVNKCEHFGGGDGPLVNALSRAVEHGKQDVIDFLVAHDAVLPPRVERPQRDNLQTLADEVIAYFTEHIGSVLSQALIEIIPTDPPISVHVIPDSFDREYVTLFTTGMSEHPMSVPSDIVDGQYYQYAELFIQLPGDWPYRDLVNPDHAWPIHWIRRMAKYPHQSNTWLGGPVTIVANGDPPEPLAPNNNFTSVMLLAERNFVSRGGRTIQLYRLTPLYAEERDLELREGIGALMRAFDSQEVSMVVDLNRPCAVKV